MSEYIYLNAEIPEELSGKRLDQALSTLFSEHSRSRLQEWIRNGDVKVNKQVIRQRDRVKTGDQIEIKAKVIRRNESAGENIPLEILYEDKALLILNKPAGMIVHPGAGNPEHTLLNALLHYDPGLKYLPRAGIVQRLDKDTTGLMVIARTQECHNYLVKELQLRNIKREYQTIVSGVMTAGGQIEKPVGRHPTRRTRMAVTDKGKIAVTHFRIIRKYRAHTHLHIQLETGRTHQIRVHMAHLRYPIVGDPVYGGRNKIPDKANAELISILRSFKRQALHASAITFKHPQTGNILHYDTTLPEDMQKLIQVLENDSKNN